MFAKSLASLVLIVLVATDITEENPNVTIVVDTRYVVYDEIFIKIKFGETRKDQPKDDQPNDDKPDDDQPNTNKRQPHIIFILGDDIGYNDVGWNNPNFHTPNMEKLAKEGVYFSNYYAMPQCTPSRATFLSGLFAQQLGLQRGVLGETEPYGIPLKYKLLPERLKSRNYSTHAMGKWHLGFCDWRYTPTLRGFDTFFGFYQGYEENYQHCLSSDDVYDPISNCTDFDFRKDWNPAKQYNGQYSSYLQNDKAVEIIKQHSQFHPHNPLFMYVALTASHFPVQGDKFAPQCKNVTESRKQMCGAMIGVDQVVLNITEALKRYKLYDNSILVFVSDNGGTVYFGGNNYPLRGDKGTLYEGGSRVPGFIHSPLLKKRGYTYDGLFHIADWHTTFLHLAGYEPDKNETLNGVNQWESVSEGKSSPRTEFPYSMDLMNGTIVGAVRVGDYKLIVGPGGNDDGWYTEEETLDNSYNPEFLKTYIGGLKYNLTDRSSKLYNLVDDPYEKNNLIDKEPKILAEVKKRFDYYFGISKPAVKIPGDPAGEAEKFGGIYSPGWCEAYFDVPVDRKKYMDQDISPAYV